MKCKICDMGYDPRGKHLRQYHNLTSKEYYDIYILENEDERFCKVCGKEKYFLGGTRGYQKSKKHQGLCRECYLGSEEHKKLKKDKEIANQKVQNKKQSEKNKKEKISKGEFTPDITNSWCHSRVEIELNNKIYKFRSSFEALYWLQFQNLSYETLRIPYVFNNENHTYVLDFIDYSKNIIYEIKPSSLVEDEKNKAKFYYAQKWCEENNYIFKIITEEEIKQNLDSLTHRELQIIKENRKLLRTYNNFNKEVV